MKFAAGLRFKTYLLISLMIVFGPLGDVSLSKGMKRIGPLMDLTPTNVFHFLHATFSSALVWMGMGSLLSFFIAYILVLSWADYSYVQPASSVGYGVVALLGYLVLRETITATRWVGIIIICVGVFVVGHTPLSTTEL